MFHCKLVQHIDIFALDVKVHRNSYESLVAASYQQNHKDIADKKCVL